MGQQVTQPERVQENARRTFTEFQNQWRSLREHLSDFRGRERNNNEQQRITELQSLLRSNEQALITMSELKLNELQKREELLRKEGQRVTDLQSMLTTKEEEFQRQEERLRDEQAHLSVLQDLLRINEKVAIELRERLEAEFQLRLDELQNQLRTTEQELTTTREQLSETQQRETDLNRTLLQYQRDNPRDWILNRNEIHLTSHRLGRGAWGSVCRGKFRGCDVAVKQMYEALNSDHSRLLFEREVHIASKCRHPCLLQLIGATADDNPPLVVTEIMDCSLRERLYSDDEPPLSTEEVFVISLDVARALNYLHQKPNPIIHSDISSANVLLWRHGNQWRGKVSDYGTANFVRQSTRNDVGAVIYCAPELVNEASDHPISCKVSTVEHHLTLTPQQTN